MTDALLVGSIPLESAADAMTTFGSPLGAHLQAMPDGEVGMRRFWISRVHFQVLAIHPDLEVLQHPRSDEGVERIYPHDASDNWNFKVRDGVDKVVFGHPGWRLGFYQDAVNSFYVFNDLKAKGVLAKHLRFQVSMPSVVSALPPRVFPHPGDLDKVSPGYADALRAEAVAILEKIPPREAAIQLDCSTELQQAYGPDSDAAIARAVGYLRDVSRDLPEEAALGFHLCFGTLGGWPRFEPESLDRAVALANAIIEGVGRRVDWVHIPLLNRSEESYYAPLANLKPKDARIYLGMIHNMDTFERRLTLARRHLPQFGVGAYCGFGRRFPAEMPEVLRAHVSALEIANR